MTAQLIFTSAPMGLEPGRSGYCTVAREKTLSQRLVREIERISVLDISGSGESAPKVDAFRLLKVGSSKVCLLSRIRSAGQDYTNRTNYLAHHLIIDPEETEGLPSPAAILAQWDGWRNEWSGNPRYLDQEDAPNLSASDIDSPDRCITWFQWSGDENNAAIPKTESSIFRIHPGDEERLLPLFAESSTQLDDPDQAWEIPFTTFLQPNDDADDFLWIGGWPETAVDRIKSATVVNSVELARFDEEMAARQLPIEEIPEEPEPLPEEPEPVPEESETVLEEPEPLPEQTIPSEPMEPTPEEPEALPEQTAPVEPMEPIHEEPVEPQQAVAYQAPQETEPMQEEIAPEAEVASHQQPQQEAVPEPAAVHPEERKLPNKTAVGRKKLKRAKQAPGRKVRAGTVKPKKSKAPTYLFIGLAAFVIIFLGATVQYLMNRVDELETQTTELAQETGDLRKRVGFLARQQAELGHEQAKNLNRPSPSPPPRPQAPRPRPPNNPPSRPPATQNTPATFALQVKEFSEGTFGLGIMRSPGSKPNPDERINFQSLLAGSVGKVLGKPSGPITQTDINRLVELDVSGASISELNGLQIATGLRSLKLVENQIRDLRPLQGLVKLNKLILTGNNIEDVRPLARLVNLTELHLNNNRINDVEAFLNLQNLVDLDLRNNRIPENQQALLRRELPNCEIRF
jgi:Leucine-rich repeat (LRR) protein